MEGSEPFPAVTEEDMREQHSREAPRHAPPYNVNDKDDTAAVELRQTNSLEDKPSSSAAREPLTSSGQVLTILQDYTQRETYQLTNIPVCQRLCTASEATMEALLRNWHEELLEMVLDTSRFPHHPVRPQRRCMGWYAVPASLQRCASHVHAHLR